MSSGLIFEHLKFALTDDHSLTRAASTGEFVIIDITDHDRQS